MEQVTEAVKAETTENRENREYRKPAVKWLIIGLIVSLAASGIFTACYGIFERRAESRRNEQYIADPLETSNTITYLYQNCYLLYRDLYNKEHQTSLSYGELYMQSTEGNEWLNDDQKRAEMADGRAVVTVADNGVGIAPEDQQRVFERFYRVDKSRSKQTGGTGLGLSIVKHGAQVHHAQIAMQSALGEGTTITLTFPAQSSGKK